MAVALDHHCVIPAFEYMPNLAMPAIETLRETAIEPPHPSPEVGLWRPDNEVVMRRHETKRQARPIVALNDAREGSDERRSVIVVAEDRLLSDAPAGDVVRSAGDLHAETPCHANEATATRRGRCPR
jgi:hypothetical protein